MLPMATVSEKEELGKGSWPYQFEGTENKLWYGDAMHNSLLVAIYTHTHPAKQTGA